MPQTLDKIENTFQGEYLSLFYSGMMGKVLKNWLFREGFLGMRSILRKGKEKKSVKNNSEKAKIFPKILISLICVRKEF